MSSTDLLAIEDTEAARTEVLHRPDVEALPSWRESLQPRLFAAGVLAVFIPFIYMLLSFHNPLQPTFTTTEVVLAFVLLGLVISRT
jgi:hypothetical protein